MKYLLPVCRVHLITNSSRPFTSSPFSPSSLVCSNQKMKAVYAPLGFALTASAAILRRDQCCFSLTASGGQSGTVGQLSDGQNRVGDNSLSAGSYCINDGAITDGQGRGCILTSPTTQFQCDTGATGMFSVCQCDGCR